METDIHDKTREIAWLIGKLGRDLENEYKHDEKLLVSVIPNKLACTHRPLRYHPQYGGSGKNISPDAATDVVDWAETISLLGLKSIKRLLP